MRPALVIVIAYLLGSIPFGYLLVRLKYGTDVRETGSGGTGATNVLRRAGKVAGVVTLILDLLKGAAAVAIAQLILGLPIIAGSIYGDINQQSAFIARAYWCVAAAGIAVIVGHIFPVWLRFRGGKGVATGVGVFLMFAPCAVALAGLVFVIAVTLTRYVSLGSILGAVAVPVFVLLQNAFIRPVPFLAPLLTVSITGAALILFAHRENIGRLLNGAERKLK